MINWDPLLIIKLNVISNSVLDKCKRIIITYILKRIKNEDLIQVDAPFLVKLQQYVNWPELESIKKSLAVNNQINEAINLDNETEAEQIAAIQNNLWIIQNIKNPTEKVQIAAVKLNGFGIKYIKNPTDKVKVIALKYDPETICYIENISKDVLDLCKLEMIKYFLSKIKGENFFGVVADIFNDVCKYVSWPELKIIEKSLNNREINEAANLNDKTEAEQIAAVSKDPWLIRDIKNPSEEVKKERGRAQFAQMKTLLS